MITKLSNIQAELKAPKSQYNSFGKYNYRNCEDILEAVKPLLLKNGLTLTVSDELVHIGDRYYIKATATVTDGEKSITTTAFAREEENKKGMDGAQVTGSTSSYARKYALNGLFCIDDNKDSDYTNTDEKPHNNAKSGGTNKPKQTPPPAQQPRFFCCVCGSPMTEKRHNQSIEKYGAPFCTKECLEMAQLQAGN